MPPATGAPAQCGRLQRRRRRGGQQRASRAKPAANPRTARTAGVSLGPQTGGVRHRAEPRRQDARVGKPRLHGPPEGCGAPTADARPTQGAQGRRVRRRFYQRRWPNTGIGRAGHEFAVYGVAFSGDGPLLATASEEKTVMLMLWDVASQTPLPALPRADVEFDCVACSPDGKILARASGDKTVRLADGGWQRGRRAVPAGRGVRQGQPELPTRQVGGVHWHQHEVPRGPPQTALCDRRSGRHIPTSVRVQP